MATALFTMVDSTIVAKCRCSSVPQEVIKKMEANAAFTKVLFLCTGNSARSIFGEYSSAAMLVDSVSRSIVRVLSDRQVNPFAIEVLRDAYHIDASAARSKSLEEFGDVEFDFVITVCDNAHESCPVWPGQPIVAHWGVPDPALAEGSDDEKFR